MNNRLIIIGVAILAALYVFFSSMYVVNERDQAIVTRFGAITDVRDITTKTGQKMAFVKIEDQFAEVEVILFPSSYQQTLGLWERDKVVIIRGKINARDKAGKRAGPKREEA